MGVKETYIPGEGWKPSRSGASYESEIEYLKSQLKIKEEMNQVALLIIGCLVSYFGGYAEVTEKDMVEFHGEVIAAKRVTDNTMTIEVKNGLQRD